MIQIEMVLKFAKLLSLCRYRYVTTIPVFSKKFGFSPLAHNSRLARNLTHSSTGAETKCSKDGEGKVDIFSENNKECVTVKNVKYDAESLLIQDKNDTKDNGKEYREHLLESWNLVVQSFGRLSINFPYHLILKAVNPIEYPNMDMLFISLYARTPIRTKEIRHVDLVDCYKMSISNEFLGKDVSIQGRISVDAEDILGAANPFYCIVQIPLQQDLDIHLTADGSAEIENTESTNISIRSKRGNIILNNVKCGGVVSAKSQLGDITVNTLLNGIVDLQTGGEGSIMCDKLQGSDVRCRSDHGNIAIKALYSERTSLSSTAGGIKVGSTHGDVTVSSEHGPVSIDSAEGSLTVDTGQGDITVGLNRHDSAQLNSKHGDININIPESSHTQFSLAAPDVSIDPNLDHSTFTKSTDGTQKYIQGETSHHSSSTIFAVSLGGRIRLTLQDWLASLNIRNK